MTPEARRDQVLVQKVGDELVVYDERTYEAHRLNHGAALVWQHADGERSVGELATLLHDTLDVPDDEEIVHLALDQLGRVGLLVQKLPLETGPITRREMFKVASYLLPAVASIVAPPPALAATCTANQMAGRYSGSVTQTAVNGNCGLFEGGTGTVDITCTSGTAFSMTLNFEHVTNYSGSLNTTANTFTATPPLPPLNRLGFTPATGHFLQLHRQHY